jgi:putative transcriptional regulator
MAKHERKPFGQRLISGLNKGLEEIKHQGAVKTTFVALPPAPEEFCREELVQLRQRLQLTQSGMAALLNVSGKTLESWEQGVRNPNGAALRLLQLLKSPEILSLIFPSTCLGNRQ